MSATNPLHQSIGCPTGQATIIIHGVTNAGYMQRVTITNPSNGTTPVPGAPTSIVFQGSGENAATMAVSLNGVVQTSPIVHLANWPAEFTCTILAQYSADGGSTWQDNSSQNIRTNLTSTGNYAIFTYESEDWIDNDFNDAILSFMFIGTGSSAR